MRGIGERLLPRAALLTLVLLYLVVLAGAVVRATGSGMGCPDWPRCYGRLVPPVRAEEIDFGRLDLAKYRKSWASHGRAEVEVTEGRVRENISAMETWIEFLNRCLGAVSGLAALATLVLAVVSGRRDLLLKVVLVGQVVLFGVVAWLGKVVVDTNLLPWKITLHMMLAMGLITTALWIRHRVLPGRGLVVTKSLRWHRVACVVAVVVQTVVGTQVREIVDQAKLAGCCGEGSSENLEKVLGVTFAWHRVGAVVVVTLVGLVFFRLRARGECVEAAPVLIPVLGLLVAMEYVAGVVLIRANLPAVVQPVHLLLAFLVHGVGLSLLLRSRLRGSETSAMVEHS